MAWRLKKKASGDGMKKKVEGTVYWDLGVKIEEEGNLGRARACWRETWVKIQEEFWGN